MRSPWHCSGRALTGAVLTVTALTAAAFGGVLSGTALAAPQSPAVGAPVAAPATPGAEPVAKPTGAPAPTPAAAPTPFRVGVMCSGPGGSTALASWASAATDAPAYAPTPVTVRPDGTPRTTPATRTSTATPYSGPNAAALAALLAAHGRTAVRATAAEVALAVAGLAGSHPDAALARCPGAVAARALRREAERTAGPYTLRLQVPPTKVVLGQPVTVFAAVTATSGAPVAGVAVHFASSDPTADLTSDATTTTGADGLAHATLVVRPGSPSRRVPLTAHADVPGTPVQMSAPGAVPLIAAGPAHRITRSRALAVDTTTDPQLSVGVDRPVVLPGTVVHPSVTVSGLRGHFGTATITSTGPLRLDPASGCTKYRADATSGTATTATLASSGPITAVRHDGTFALGALTLTRPGCYVLTGGIATSNAMPNVRRQMGRQIVAVAPVHVTVDPAGHGVTTAGALSARVSTAGRMPATLTGVQGSLLGPVPSDDGSCTSARFTGSGIPLHVAAAANGVQLSGANAKTIGCYGFHVTGTVSVAHLGAIPLAWSGPLSATALVIDPSVSVDGLSGDAVVAGGRVDATVTVSGSWAQRGELHLQLERLPYDWRGCFGRDWSGATTVDLPPGPAAATSGDGSYRVQTPIVPGQGCWTVVPVLTMTRNAALSVTDSAPIDPMTAFTALRPVPRAAARSVPLRLASASITGQEVSAGVAMLLLMLLAAASTLSIALREQ